MKTPSPPAPSPAPRTLAARRALLERAAHGVDIVVVGGGITGAGTARDATLRGLKVLVVDAGDWAQGTSSRSSKLVHGGLRYLENFQFGLVMEGTRERHRQAKLNPHLVEPLAFLMPVYEGSRNSLFKINLGLWLYDLLALFRTHRLHRKLNATRTSEVAPPLRSSGLKGAIHYFDCKGDDARLTLANVLDAERHGALTANHTSFDGPLLDEHGSVRGAMVRDVQTGETFEIPCAHIAIAAGPWTDTLADRLGHPHRLRPTRGVHLVFDRARLPLDVAVALSSVDDGRVVFAIPFGNTTYVGTTDTDHAGTADDVAATAEDVAYLLRTANHFFPDAHLTPSDVRSTWAALRPLVRSDAETAYKTSREHEIWHDPRGISTIAGGKLTTYRAMAEEYVDGILKAMKRHGREVSARRCTTHKLPLDPGAPLHPQGSLAAIAEARIAAHPEEGERLDPSLPYRYADVAVSILHEHAQTLEDVLVRRFQVFFRAADRGLGVAPRVAELLARHLERDAAWTAAEVARYRAYVAAHMDGVQAAEAALAPSAQVG